MRESSVIQRGVRIIELFRVHCHYTLSSVGRHCADYSSYQSQSNYTLPFFNGSFDVKNSNAHGHAICKHPFS